MINHKIFAHNLQYFHRLASMFVNIMAFFCMRKRKSENKRQNKPCFTLPNLLLLRSTVEAVIRRKSIYRKSNFVVLFLNFSCINLVMINSCFAPGYSNRQSKKKSRILYRISQKKKQEENYNGEPSKETICLNP